MTVAVAKEVLTKHRAWAAMESKWYAEAVSVAIEALEKRTEKEPEYSDMTDTYFCPTCGCPSMDYGSDAYVNYCANCGQHLKPEQD